MDEEEKPFLAGFLTIKSQSGFSIRISKKPRYCQLFRASRNGIERLEISDSESDKNTRIVTLENCVKIVLETSVNIINIVTKTGQIQLHSTNDATIKEWKVALQSVAFKEKSVQSNTLSSNAIIEEDNDLYCSSYSENIFTVTLIPTDASMKCGLEPKMFTLMLSNTEIQLKCYEDESIIVAKWPYRFIRKYGYRDGKFTFEAGRKCDTGEGTFKLDNVNPQEIFRCMSTKMKSMKKIMNGESFNRSTHSIQNQLSAALSMEPGSRNPLPPSSQSSFAEIESHNSFHGILSSTELFNSSTLCSKNGIPIKPPRKPVPPMISNTANFKPHSEQRSLSRTSNVSSVFIQNLDNFNDLSDSTCSNPVPLPCEGNRDYECVEDITEAWKKLGIDDINHTENPLTSDEELREFVRERSKSSWEYSSKSRNEKIKLGEDSNTNLLDDNYDKLDFFRTSHKVSSGYKTIVPIKLQTAPPRHNTNSSDDYEVVGSPASTSTSCASHNIVTDQTEGYDNNANQTALVPPDTSPYRKADDSCIGYGIIRKTSIQSQNLVTHSSPIPANSFNEESDKVYRFDYATVSKPKRV
ncbi:uncharacterized protein LOC129763612 [Toxorhynchites rutilus septentrionalis]|uniref:uncharacterized protein LOC129763612 n=1 Tax=Toxorhynchites rutilus septentrionalis TaxID=329112 RepID=UPI0024788417|nr:uncharacterized protein LOC129763612 [Toxorhynchites rutilus septentrionalis]